ncbi:MAG: transketolase [Saprospiraceae bacterium]|nr:transketolase [Saprospiraceae bacterium]
MKAISKLTKEEVLQDYHCCLLSREVSFLLRKEVLNGRAKFGAGNAGKELPLVALAKTFEKGDFWSGYYRDQTLMFRLGIASPIDFFAALYGDAINDPLSGGRQMTNHYSTPLVDSDGNWLPHTDRLNAASTISPVAGHVAHALGLANASKVYRSLPKLDAKGQFSQAGNEVIFCTIGDASAVEGVFFEAVNAAGVMRVPIAYIVVDDGYGISVPAKYQMTKENISEALAGFQVDEQGRGLDIYAVKAWDYQALCDTFKAGIAKIRETHIPAIFHVQECTQQYGHSTSGSHERYKPASRLAWEKEMDCNRHFEQWIISEGLASPAELESIQIAAKKEAEACRDKAWDAYSQPVEAMRQTVTDIYQRLIKEVDNSSAMSNIAQDLAALKNPALSHILDNARQMQIAIHGQDLASQKMLTEWIMDAQKEGKARYSTHLHSDTPRSALQVAPIPAQYSESSPSLNGHEILNHFFDQALAQYPNLLAFGEDVGQIGGVNQAFAGLQAKYGEERIFDTGIREWTIAGQGIGLAMRGLRPIAELQYLDYLAYAFSPLTDDLATLRYRTKGTQIAPTIIRTRGHRLEGIWHSGSPLGMLLHSMRGIYVLVPRNMVQAAGMYQTLLQSDDPAILIECLNGYRVKERLPDNLDNFRVALGTPEVLQDGHDLTLVTYGSCVRIAQAALPLLADKGIQVELIDVQTLLPFDLEHRILHSLQKTNRILFLDEDVPGGASAFMLQQVLEEQGGYQYLDSPPATLTAKAHRPAFGDDGDYFSKPSTIDVFWKVYQMMQESDPIRFPA